VPIGSYWMVGAASPDAEQFLGVVEKLFTGTRERDGTLATLEELDAEILFERGDPGRDRCLRRVQLLRSRGKVAQARHPDKSFNETQVQERQSYMARGRPGVKLGLLAAVVAYELGLLLTLTLGAVAYLVGWLRRRHRARPDPTPAA